MMNLRSSVWLRKQQLWILAIGVLFVADFVLCGYWPSRSRLTALTQRQVGYQQTIEVGRAKGVQLEAVRKRLGETEETIKHYDAYVPTESSLGTFLRQASELMTQHQLSDQAVVKGKETRSGGLVCLPVHVTGAGELKDIFSFFRDLRNLDRLVRVDRVSLKNDNGFSGRVTMEAEVVIYHHPGQTAAEGKTTGTPAGGGANHGA
jgi:Tfp pilus assembly protein PilO